MSHKKRTICNSYPLWGWEYDNTGASHSSEGEASIVFNGTSASLGTSAFKTGRSKDTWSETVSQSDEVSQADEFIQSEAFSTSWEGISAFWDEFSSKGGLGW